VCDDRTEVAIECRVKAVAIARALRECGLVAADAGEHAANWLSRDINSFLIRLFGERQQSSEAR
jgi:hypothetical protein